MARELIILPRFKRDYRNARRHPDFDVEILEYVCDLLISGEKLPSALREHRVSKPRKKWSGFTECHLGADLLLVYRVRRRAVICTAWERIGSYSPRPDSAIGSGCRPGAKQSSPVSHSQVPVRRSLRNRPHHASTDHVCGGAPGHQHAKESISGPRRLALNRHGPAHFFISPLMKARKSALTRSGSTIAIP